MKKCSLNGDKQEMKSMDSSEPEDFDMVSLDDISPEDFMPDNEKKRFLEQRKCNSFYKCKDYKLFDLNQLKK
jgi:hypothetical protein